MRLATSGGRRTTVCRQRASLHLLDVVSILQRVYGGLSWRSGDLTLPLSWVTFGDGEEAGWKSALFHLTRSST